MSNKDNSTEYRFSGYRIDLRQRRVFDSGGKALRLSSRAFDTLLVLVENAGETVSKARLMDAVWPSLVVEENNLNQAISSLRKALGDTKTRSRYILTVPGKGYGFIAELERYESPPVPTAQHDSTAAPLPAASIATLPRRRLATLLPVLLLAVMALGGFIWLTQDAGLPGDTDAAATTTPISSSTDV
ncbi:MAG TPA: transcriptional regulator, partial [Pseudomonadaceae bacterium]|nr:transcriptional regulator [Pseudomonadaceae bacterium]